MGREFTKDSLRKNQEGRCGKINTRVVGPNLRLPSLEELNGADITYACATNADRNLQVIRFIAYVSLTHE